MTERHDVGSGQNDFALRLLWHYGSCGMTKTAAKQRKREQAEMWPPFAVQGSRINLRPDWSAEQPRFGIMGLLRIVLSHTANGAERSDPGRTGHRLRDDTLLFDDGSRQNALAKHRKRPATSRSEGIQQALLGETDA